jgi:hypothetical protein
MNGEKYFTRKIFLSILLFSLVISSITILPQHSHADKINLRYTPDDIVWNITLSFSETDGRNDYIIFGESPNATDGVDIYYDIVNPPAGVSPFLDAYFTTSFSYPYNTLLQEIKVYPDSYEVWNFTVWWTGDDTFVNISWNSTKFYLSEYETAFLYDDTGALLLDMIDFSTYEFLCPGNGMVNFQIQVAENKKPLQSNPYPNNNSINIERPPNELNITVEDFEGDPMDVFILWKNHTGEWISLQVYYDVGNGSYSYIPPFENDWIWGNTTYLWKVCITDSTLWENITYIYNTKGSRYDVNNDNNVNFQDAGLVWVHRTNEAPYDGIYDVNNDNEITFQDAGLTWINRN